jgi:hypothetical protein
MITAPVVVSNDLLRTLLEAIIRAAKSAKA